MAQTVKVCLQCRRPGFNPWVEIFWRRTWQLTPTILAWKIPWTEEPGRLQSMGSQRVGHDWATLLSFSVDAQLHWFHLSVIVNNAIVNLGIQVYLFRVYFQLLGYILVSGIGRFYGNYKSTFSFLKNRQAAFHWALPVYEGFQYLCNLTGTCFVIFKIFWPYLMASIPRISIPRPGNEPMPQ